MIFAASLLGLALGALPTGPDALGKVAVLDVQAEAVEARLVPVLTEVLTAELARTGRFSAVIASRDVKAMLSFEERRQILGCSDESCLAEIGGALGSDRIVVCNVARIGAGLVLTLKLIDIVEARTDARAYRRVADEAALLEALPAAVNEMLSAPTAAAVAQTTPTAPADPAPSADVSAATEAPPRAGARILPIALLAVGGASLGVGVGFGVHAKSERDTAIARNTVGSQRSIDSGKRSQLIANLGFGIGGAAVLAGALWWWLGSDEAPATALLPTVDAGTVGLQVGGSF